MSTCGRWIGLALLVTIAAPSAVGCSLEGASASSELLTCRTTDRGGPSGDGGASLYLVDLPHNNLASEAVKRVTLTDPNVQHLLRAIMNGGLANRDTLSDYDRTWLSSSQTTAGNARALMKYVVSCALDPGMEGPPDISADGVPVTWRGELGLCSDRPGALGSWASAAPTQACLQAVSSCVLARVNAHNKKVVISMRGESTALLPLRPKVPVETEYRYNDGTPIRSLTQSCSPADDQPTRDCGWKGRYVGSCIAGQEVQLQVNGTAMMRVCRGLYGCDHADTPAPGDETGYHTPWYAGHMVSVDQLTGPLSFTCPRTGISVPDRFYFSVMLASKYQEPLPDELDVTLVGPPSDEIRYPSPEREVFTFREGAFFGNIFDAVPPIQNQPDDLLTGYQYACYSDVWRSGIAHLADRECAGSPDCFENDPLPCLNRCPMQSCDTGAYLDCTWDVPAPRAWDHPITVYLNHPCDLSRDLQSCMSALK